MSDRFDAGYDEVEAAAELRTVFAVARRVAPAEQGESRDAGVGDVGGVLDAGTLDAVALGTHPPAATLAPAAVGVLLVDEVGEALVDGVAKGFGCHGPSTSRRRVSKRVVGRTGRTDCLSIIRTRSPTLHGPGTWAGRKTVITLIEISDQLFSRRRLGATLGERVETSGCQTPTFRKGSWMSDPNPPEASARDSL